MPQAMPRLAALALCTSLAACVMVPRTHDYYDEQCKVHSRQMTLEPAQVGTLGGCSNDGCAGLLVAYGVVGAASVVVSGSVVVVGNVVYWIERRANCADRAEEVKRGDVR